MNVLLDLCVQISRYLAVTCDDREAGDAADLAGQLDLGGPHSD
jgi:hypothetical protein